MNLLSYYSLRNVPFIINSHCCSYNIVMRYTYYIKYCCRNWVQPLISSCYGLCRSFMRLLKRFLSDDNRFRLNFCASHRRFFLNFKSKNSSGKKLRLRLSYTSYRHLSLIWCIYFILTIIGEIMRSYIFLYFALYVK